MCLHCSRAQNISKLASAAQENLLLEFGECVGERARVSVCWYVCVSVCTLRDLSFNFETFNVTIKFHFEQDLNYFWLRPGLFLCGPQGYVNETSKSQIIHLK